MDSDVFPTPNNPNFFALPTEYRSFVRRQLQDRPGGFNPSPCRRVLSSLAKIPSVVRDIACPVLRIDSKLHHAMERRVRPIPDLRDKSVLDGVDMDVIDMMRKIVLVANGVLPIAPLSDAAFALGGAAV
jgi:hypothetical protein